GCACVDIRAGIEERCDYRCVTVLRGEMQRCECVAGRPAFGCSAPCEQHARDTCCVALSCVVQRGPTITPGKIHGRAQQEGSACDGLAVVTGGGTKRNAGEHCDPCDGGERGSYPGGGSKRILPRGRIANGGA